MDPDLRAELDKLWARMTAQDLKLGEITTRMAVADVARASNAQHLAELSTDIKQINATLSSIAITMATGRGMFWLGRAVVAGCAVLVGWAAAFLHINVR